MDDLSTIESRLGADIRVCLAASKYAAGRRAEAKAHKPQADLDKAAMERVKADLPAHQKVWNDGDDWKAYICKKFGISKPTLRRWLPAEAKSFYTTEPNRSSVDLSDMVQIDNEQEEGPEVSVFNKALQILMDHPEDHSLTGSALATKYPESGISKTPFVSALQYLRGRAEERAELTAFYEKRLRRLTTTEAPEGMVLLDKAAVRVLKAAVHVDKARPLDAQYEKMAQAAALLEKA